MIADATTPRPHPLDAILASLHESPPRVASIVVSLFGDVVAPRGGSIWLGTLLAIFKGMGIEPNAVRTAMSRLAADGWVARNRIGRNSYYRLTPGARAETLGVAPAIYGGAPPPWDGALRLAITPTPPVSVEDARKLRRAGYRLVLPGFWAALGAGAPPRTEADMIPLAASGDEAAVGRLLGAALAAESAMLFAPIRPLFAPLLDADPPPAGLSALVVRILLIHHYRQGVLRARGVPAALLPADWPGHEARRICAALYRALLPASELWLDVEAQCESGALPTGGPALWTRFAEIEEIR